MLPDLRGNWHIRRRIFGRDLRFAGQLGIDENGRYHETGNFENNPSRAFRDYIYRQDGDRLQIFFPDQKPFLNLHFENGIARDTHFCGDDVYDAVFRFKNGRWLTAYGIKGPRKNFIIVSIMKRLK